MNYTPQDSISATEIEVLYILCDMYCVLRYLSLIQRDSRIWYIGMRYDLSYIKELEISL